MNDLSIVAVIPLYNGARWIEQSIASVLAQTLPPDEVIVVNDGSTDDGPAIVERLAKQHPVIQLVHQSNGGQSAARNTGVQYSNSALIALLDQDDIWYPVHLERLVRPFELRQDIHLGWVYSNIDMIDDDGMIFCRNFLNTLRGEHPKRQLMRCLSEDLHILPAASLISRKAFEAVGGFDERLCGYEDDDLFLRMFRARWDNIYLPGALTCWRRHDANASHSPRMAMSRMIFLRKLLAEFPDDPRQRLYLVRDCIAPKFTIRTLGNLVVALERRDPEMFRMAIEHLDILIPLLPVKYRAMLSAAQPFLRSRFLAPFVMAAGRLARRIVRPHDPGHRAKAAEAVS